MIKDSLNRQSNIKALHEAEIKYEYEKKNSADSIFYAEEQKIADAKLDVLNAELRSQNRMTNGIIFILFLIFNILKKTLVNPIYVISLRSYIDFTPCLFK